VWGWWRRRSNAAQRWDGIHADGQCGGSTRRSDGTTFMQVEDRGIVRWTMIWIPTLALSLLGVLDQGALPGTPPWRHRLGAPPVDWLLHPSIPLLIVLGVSS
jgi:hypothetical protein